MIESTMLRKIVPLYFNFNRHVIQNTRLYVLSSARAYSKSNKSGTSVLDIDTKTIRPDPKNTSFSRNRESVLSTPSEDVLAPIRSLKTTEEVLEYMKVNPNPDTTLYAPILNSLLQLQQNNCSNLSDRALIQTEAFERLCRHIKKNSRFLKVNDIVNILKVLLNFDISTNSILCQHLLQLITKHVNRLSLAQIIFLEYILSKRPSSPLLDGLKIALPIVFETNVRSQLRYNHSKAVSAAIVYACHSKSSSEETLEYLVDAALNIKKTFRPREAISIVMGLFCVRKEVPKLFELYQEMMLIINSNIFDVDFGKLCNLIRFSLDGFVNVDSMYYDDDLMKNAVKYAIQGKINFHDTGALLRNFNRVSYYCPELLDYADDSLRNMNDFTSLSTLSVFSFVISCSNCLYKPKHWHLYESKIVSYFEKNKSPQLPMAKILVDLIVMGCWPTSLIKHCFQNEFIEQSLDSSTNKYLDYVCLLNLYQVVKSFRPLEYSGPLLSPEILENASNKLALHKDYALIGALAQGLNGQQYVLSGVRTKLGHFIDHLIVKRKSGETFVVNPEKIEGYSGKLIETLELPEDSYLIGIYVLSPVAFCLEGTRMRGKIKICIESIECLGIAIVPVALLNWMNLPDYEKIPYLMEKIRTCQPANLSVLKACDGQFEE